MLLLALLPVLHDLPTASVRVISRLFGPTSFTPNDVSLVSAPAAAKVSITKICEPATFTVISAAKPLLATGVVLL